MAEEKDTLPQEGINNQGSKPQDSQKPATPDFVEISRQVERLVARLGDKYAGLLPYQQTQVKKAITTQLSLLPNTELALDVGVHEVEKLKEAAAAADQAQKEEELKKAKLAEFREDRDILEMERAQQQAALEKTRIRLNLNQAPLDITAAEKMAKMDETAEQIFPGLNKKFSQMTMEEVQSLFDGLTPEERKTKAEAMLPVIGDALAAQEARLENIEARVDNQAKQNKLRHRLRQDHIEGQIDEMEERVGHGQGDLEIKKSIEASKELLGDREGARQEVCMLTEKRDYVQEVVQEKVVEEAVEQEKLVVADVAKEEKEAVRNVREAKYRQFLEAVAGEAGITVTDEEPIENSVRKLAEKTIQNKELMENPMVAVVDGQLRKDFPEIYERVEKELAQQEEKKPLNGETLPEQNKETGKDKGFEEKVKHLGAVFQPNAGQTQTSSWQQRIDNPSTPPEKGGNGRGR